MNIIDLSDRLGEDLFNCKEITDFLGKDIYYLHKDEEESNSTLYLEYLTLSETETEWSKNSPTATEGIIEVDLFYSFEHTQKALELKKILRKYLFSIDYQLEDRQEIYDEKTHMYCIAFKYNKKIMIGEDEDD